MTLGAAGAMMDVTAAAVSRMRMRSDLRAVENANYNRQLDAIGSELMLKFKM